MGGINSSGDMKSLKNREYRTVYEIGDLVNGDKKNSGNPFENKTILKVIVSHLGVEITLFEILKFINEKLCLDLENQINEDLNFNLIKNLFFNFILSIFKNTKNIENSKFLE